MARSYLMHRRVGPAPGTASIVVIALHGEGGNMEQMQPLATGLGKDVAAYIPEAVRITAFGPGAPVESAPSELGKSWFVEHGPGQIEPSIFGDTFAQIELFLFDVIDQERGAEATAPIYVLGFEQGATLALALASLQAQLIAGVIAICGHLPDMPEAWDPFPDGAHGLPVLLIHEPEDPEFPAEFTVSTAHRLREAGARVDIETLAGARNLSEAIEPRMGDWLAARQVPRNPRGNVPRPPVR